MGTLSPLLARAARTGHPPGDGRTRRTDRAPADPARRADQTRTAARVRRSAQAQGRAPRPFAAPVRRSTWLYLTASRRVGPDRAKPVPSRAAMPPPGAPSGPVRRPSPSRRGPAPGLTQSRPLPGRTGRPGAPVGPRHPSRLDLAAPDPVPIPPRSSADVGLDQLLGRRVRQRRPGAHRHGQRQGATGQHLWAVCALRISRLPTAVEGLGRGARARMSLAARPPVQRPLGSRVRVSNPAGASVVVFPSDTASAIAVDRNDRWRRALGGGSEPAWADRGHHGPR